MRNREEYLKNTMKYFQEGMDIVSACDRAIAVDYLGEEFINGLGEDAPQVINFINIIQRYVVLDEQLKLENNEK